MPRYLMFWLAAAMLCASACARADDGPPQKPGLWETRVQTKGTTLISRMCVDAASRAAAHAKTDAFMKQNCSKYETRHEGGKWISDSVCTFSGTQVIGHTVTTADGDATVHTTGTTNADSTWLGPCTPGQKPGVPTLLPG